MKFVSARSGKSARRIAVSNTNSQWDLGCLAKNGWAEFWALWQLQLTWEQSCWCSTYPIFGYPIEPIKTSKICSYLTSPHVCGLRYGRSKSGRFHCTRDIPLSTTNHVVKSYPISTILTSTVNQWPDLEFYVTGFPWFDLVPWLYGIRFGKNAIITLDYKWTK